LREYFRDWILLREINGGEMISLPKTDKNIMFSKDDESRSEMSVE